MNNAILMCLISEPTELRYTVENQTPVATTRIEFTQYNGSEQGSTFIRASAFGKKAEELHAIAQGSAVVLEGSIRINKIERPEGFKENRAEFIISAIYPIAAITAPAEQKLAPAAEEELISHPV